MKSSSTIVKYINREISWLSFNERVLQEAADPTVPLLERLKFLGIFSNNRDEFFRVRVAGLMRIIHLKKKDMPDWDENPVVLLKRVQETLARQQFKFDSIHRNLLDELRREDIHIVSELELNEDQLVFIKKFFEQKILPALVPIMLQQAPGFPYLKDELLYLIINMKQKKRKLYALVEVPTDNFSRFVILPQLNRKRYVIRLEDVIRANLDVLFPTQQFEEPEAHTIKLTRDAELEFDEDISKSLAEKIAKGLKKRKTGQPVRLIYDKDIAKDTLRFLFRKLKIQEDDYPRAGGRYHNSKDYMNFPDLGPASLRYRQLKPASHSAIKPGVSLFDVIQKQDILLTYPYQSFHHIIDLLREASIDPNVKVIKMTIYRVSRNSNVLNALINATKNGKKVTVIVELQARFDEAANLYWAERLADAGIKVIYTTAGIKAHAKLFLIERKTGNKTLQFAHIGTGNFNEDTAIVFSDMSLITADLRITKEVADMFRYYTFPDSARVFKHLLVAPMIMRTHINKLIDAETANARKGKPAYISLKLNNLVDRKIIDKLYRASQHGVQIKLNVRGICSLIPGIKGVSENIEGISIVDRFLEHARIYVFCNNEDPLYFISSADLMTRNLDFRTEVAVPIYSEAVKKQLKDFLDIQWKDNIKARVIDGDQNNNYKVDSSRKVFRSQFELQNYFQKLSGDKKSEN